MKFLILQWVGFVITLTAYNAELQNRSEQNFNLRPLRTTGWQVSGSKKPIQRKWLSSASPLNPSGVYSMIPHCLQSTLDLMDYWRRRSGVIFVQTNRKFQGNYWMQRLKDDFEIVLIDKTSNLTEKLLIQSQNHVNIVLFSGHYHNKLIMEQIISLGLLKSNHNWILVDTSLPKIPSKTYISPDSQVTAILENCGSQETLLPMQEARAPIIPIYDIFFSRESNSVEHIKFAHWSALQGLLIFEEFEAEDHISGLRGRSFRALAFQKLPYLIVDHVNGLRKFLGFTIDAFKAVVSHLNASFNIVEYPESIWGTLENGTFTGLTGKLYRRESDIALAPMHYTTENNMALRFFTIIGNVELAMTYRMPEASVPTDAHWLPFPNDVWICTFALLLTILACFAVIMIFSPNWATTDDALPPKFRLIMWTFFVNALEDPRGKPAKIVFVSLLLATLMTFQLYSAELFATLSNQGVKFPIRTVDDLAGQAVYRPVFSKNGLCYDIFRFSDRPDYNSVWRLAQSSENECVVKKVTEVAAQIFRGKYVAIFDLIHLRMMVQDQCSVAAFKFPSALYYLYFTSRLDFPYSRMLYLRMLRLYDGGVITRLKRKYRIGVRPTCKQEGENISFGFGQVLLPFFILIGGTIASLVALLVENCFPNYRNARNE